MQSDTLIDQKEVERFDAIASQWWDPKGPFAPLHKLTPARITYLRNEICDHLNRDPNQPNCLQNVRILDIGCGGGLVCEPLASLGASMTGIDPGSANINAATLHSKNRGLEIDYRSTTAEALVEKGETFDIVLCLEVVEHVPNVPEFIKVISNLAKPGGKLLLSTLNRTMKSFALAIVGAEYILRWLEPGTHQWNKFVTPEELKDALQKAALAPTEATGLVYNPLTGRWRLSSDIDVNYFISARKREQSVSEQI